MRELERLVRLNASFDNEDSEITQKFMQGMEKYIEDHNADLKRRFEGVVALTSYLWASDGCTHEVVNAYFNDILLRTSPGLSRNERAERQRNFLSSLEAIEPACAKKKEASDKFHEFAIIQGARMEEEEKSKNLDSALKE